MNSIELIYFDLFCGAGGTSTGVENATVHGQKCARVIACVNHDALAIESHVSNHPHTLHFTEDIRTLDVSKLAVHLERMKRIYPNAKVVLWASLECTNFSKAKGGQPRDGDSRTLADHLDRYVLALKPDYVQVENVEEFMAWGELDENGKPVSMKKGLDYIRWKNRISSYGYQYDYRILNAADFGAFTSRKRYFGQFAQLGLPIAWPEPTHSKAGADVSDQISQVREKTLKKWKAVKEVLDLENEGISIFERKKPLSEKTMERIYAGLVKYVAGGKEYFIHQRNSGNPSSKVASVEAPARTITTTGGNQDLVHVQFMQSYFGNGGTHSIEEPAPTVTTKDRFAMISTEHWIMDTQYNNVGRSIEDPAPVITANRKHHYLVTTETGEMAIAIYATDSPMTVKIKQFMAAYGIVDIKMRMLLIHELLLIMGFPGSYILKGTQADKKKFIGNAVVTVMAQKLAESLAYKLLDVCECVNF